MPEIETALSRVEMTTEIVSAYVEHNSVPTSELPALIRSVHDALDGLSGETRPAAAPEPLQPKVPVRKSIATDYIVCLEDGRRFKSLKRHLQAEHGLTPDAYRARWGLAKDYPMVAPAYADARSNLAKSIGLGRKPAVPAAAGSPDADGQVDRDDHDDHDHAAHDHAHHDHAAQDGAGRLGAGLPGAAAGGGDAAVARKTPGRRKASVG